MAKQPDTKKTAIVMVPAPAPAPAPSALVPRLVPGTSGRRSPVFPELNYRVLGKRLGISSSFLGRILSGNNRPSMALAEKIAALMGWSLDQVNALYKPTDSVTKTTKAAKESPQNGKSRNHHASGAAAAAGTSKRTGKRK